MNTASQPFPMAWTCAGRWSLK